MNPILIILVFVGLVNAGIIIPGCTLLPGGSPPCFPSTLDQTENENGELKETANKGKKTEGTANKGGKLKEIIHELQAGKVFRYNGIDDSGNFIKLGQRWQEIVGTQSDTVVCERNTTDQAYLKEYETILEFIPFSNGESNFDFEMPTPENGDVNDWFLITRREVWTCRGKQETETSSLNFLRIVTELLGRSRMRSLNFFDGFEVVFIPHSQKKDDLIPIVREIKYLRPESFKVVKYEGYLEFQQTKNGGEVNSYFNEVEIYPVIFSADKTQYKEIGHTEENRKEKKEIEQTWFTGSKNDYDYQSLEMGSPPAKLTIGNYLDVATCKRNNEKDPNLYADIYHIHWMKTVLGNSNLMVKKDFAFLTRFVLTKHELWTCMIKKTKKVFTRSVMEYIGTHPIHEIIYYSDMIYLWKFVLNLKKQSQSIAVRDIAYFDGQEHVFYDGWIKEKEHFTDTLPIHVSKLLPSSSRPNKKEREVEDIWTRSIDQWKQ